MTNCFFFPNDTKAEEDHIRAACEVKKNTVRSSVIDLWRRLEVGRYVASFQGLTNSFPPFPFSLLLWNLSVAGGPKSAR